MPLTDTQLRSLKPKEKAYKVADGGGLYIHVTPKGSKLWRHRYYFNGSEKLASFGAYPAVSLSRAREKRSEAKTLLADGIDPMAKAKADKVDLAAINEDIFSNIANELVEKKRKEGKAETTLKKNLWLLSMANSDFGRVAIRELTPAKVLETLRKVEAKGNYESAKRLRAIIGEVCRYAVATARLDADPTYSLRGALIAPTVRHMAAAITKKDFSRIVKAVWQYQDGAPATRAALKLMILLYPRPGELRLAMWNEFDLENGVWTVPAARMKMRKGQDHRKPLPSLAVKVLQKLKVETWSEERVFPSSISKAKPMSENTMNQALRRMGFDKDEHTSHGFRSSASSLLNESGLWNKDAIEAELAHQDRNAIRGIYNRSRYWDERLRMTQWWSEEVVRLRDL